MRQDVQQHHPCRVDAEVFSSHLHRQITPPDAGMGCTNVKLLEQRFEVVFLTMGSLKQ